MRKRLATLGFFIASLIPGVALGSLAAQFLGAAAAIIGGGVVLAGAGGILLAAGAAAAIGGALCAVGGLGCGNPPAMPSGGQAAAIQNQMKANASGGLPSGPLYKMDDASISTAEYQSANDACEAYAAAKKVSLVDIFYQNGWHTCRTTDQYGNLAGFGNVFNSSNGCATGLSSANGVCITQQDLSASKFVKDGKGRIVPNPANPPTAAGDGIQWFDLNNSDATGEIATNASGDKVRAEKGADGSQILHIDSGGVTDAAIVQSWPSGDTQVSHKGSSNATDPNGGLVKINYVGVGNYDSNGNLTSSNAYGDSNMNGYTVLGNNGSSGTISTTTGTGMGTSGSGKGNCASGDCATETTQIANRGLLQAIKDFLTTAGTAPGDPVSKTSGEIEAAGLDGGSTFNPLKGWRLPAHTSACPVGQFFVWNRQFVMDSHCTLVQNTFGPFRGLMVLFFTWAAMIIVLKA